MLTKTSNRLRHKGLLRQKPLIDSLRESMFKTTSLSASDKFSFKMELIITN